MIDQAQNAAALEDLRKRHDTGNVIAFLGAGASAPIFPLWSGLLDLMVVEAKARGALSDHEVEALTRRYRSDPAELAGQIKHRIGAHHFSRLLREVFGAGHASRADKYTRLHGAVARSGCKAVVTTNYDSCFIDARVECRPDIGATGWFTAHDRDALEEWIGHKVYERCQMPIMHLHGHFERPDTIVLTKDDYKTLYDHRNVRRLVEDWFLRHNMLFVGIGFADAWWEYLVNEVTRGLTLKDHFALIGLDNEAEAPMLRRSLVGNYGIQPIFYKVDNGSHDAGAQLLENLLGAPSPPPRKKKSTAKGAKGASNVAAKAANGSGEEASDTRVRWRHEKTHDRFFTGRSEAIAKLDRWIGDDEVRCIAIVGIGGLGKTSLLGRWVFPPQNAPSALGEADLILFWSFYHDRDASELLRFIADTLTEPRADAGHNNASEAFATIFEHAERAERHVVLLFDGLEVIQENAQSFAYGEVKDTHISRLLQVVLKSKTFRIVATSRFPIADLDAEIGRYARVLYPPPLSPDEGAALLAKMEVNANAAELRATSLRLSGHPLALRILALSLRKPKKGDQGLTLFELTANAQLDHDHPLEKKLGRLLEFYEKSITSEQRDVLGLMALTSTGVSSDVLVRLASRDKAVAIDADRVMVALEEMSRSGLVIHDVNEDTYSVHPVVRDYFRAQYLNEAGASAASILRDSPGETFAKSPRALQKYIDSISIFCDLGQFEDAFDVYKRRLLNGRVFRDLGAVREGFEAVYPFIRSDAIRSAVGNKLSPRVLSSLVNEAAIFSSLGGNFHSATRYFDDSNALDAARKDYQGLAIGKLNFSECLFQQGLLQKAVLTCREGLDALAKAPSSDVANDLYNWLGYYRWLQGQPDAAIKDLIQSFTKGDTTSRRDTQAIAIVINLLAYDRLDKGAATNAAASLGAAIDASLRAWLAASVFHFHDAPPGAKDAIKEGITRSSLAREMAIFQLVGSWKQRHDGNFAAAAEHAAAALDQAASKRLPLLQIEALIARTIALSMGVAAGVIEQTPTLEHRVAEDLENAMQLTTAHGYVLARHKLQRHLNANRTLGLLWKNGLEATYAFKPEAGLEDAIASSVHKLASQLGHA